MRALLAFLLLLTACDEGPSADLVYEGRTACSDAAHGGEAYFNDTMLPEFFTPYCLYCHSSELEGELRHGAPQTLNYDVYASAKSLNATTWARVASAEMPPLGRLPSAEEYAMLLDFLNCSAPDTSDLMEDLIACPDTSLAYADIEPVFDEHCTRCHHSALSGGDRNGAPPGRDWDQPQALRDAGVDLVWRRVFDGEMPLGGPALIEANADHARALHAYLSCGAPD
jgi:hypothetical protein